jgi:hypothetical protein
VLEMLEVVTCVTVHFDMHIPVFVSVFWSQDPIAGISQALLDCLAAAKTPAIICKVGNKPQTPLYTLSDSEAQR